MQLSNYYITKLRFCSLLKGGLLSVKCWGPTTDTVIFEFYCDTGAGCDTDVQFWYRLWPSPVGVGEESLMSLFGGLLVSSTSTSLWWPQSQSWFEPWLRTICCVLGQVT